MDASVKLGRFLNIPIGLNKSWFLIFAFLTWSLATGYFPGTTPGFSTITFWILAAISAVLFFGSVLAHELGHSVIALRNGIPVRSITLFIFGGVAQIEREPESPGAEFRIAIAGPITSLILAAMFWAVSQLGDYVPFLAAPSLWLARTNFILAIFNMIPGFPLDGGRVLRAIVWKLSDSMILATKVASIGGQIVAFSFIGLGVFSLFSGNFSNGIWLGLIGLFLNNAAASSYSSAKIEQSLKDVTVEQVMSTGIPHISSLMSLERLVNDYVLPFNQRAFIVIENEEAKGLLTVQDISEIPRRKWPFMSTGQVMEPLDRTVEVAPGTKLVEVIKNLQRSGTNSVAVVQQGQVVGTISEDDVKSYLHLKSKLSTR
jgi:Zn-dependent protease/CBS domain-containing protein